MVCVAVEIKKGGMKMPTVILGPRCNRRVTCSPDPHNDRSESAVIVNPTDPYNMVGSSKKFTDPHTYAFSLAAYCTFDGVGNAYLIGLLFGVPTATDPYHFLGMAAYKSTDGGLTWSTPTVIHRG